MNEREVAQNATEVDVTDLRRRVEYFRTRYSELAATLLRNDAAASAARHELEQKRRGFSLLAKIMATVGTESRSEIFRMLSVEINPTLNMQRTAVLLPAGDGTFRPGVLQGYDHAEAAMVSRGPGRRVPDRMLHREEPVLLNSEFQDATLTDMRDWLVLPYFVSMPVAVEGQIEAVIVAGRTRERFPFMPRLGPGDAETMQAMAAFVASVLLQRRMAEMEHLAYHDALTGLPNARLGRKRLLKAINEAREQADSLCVLYVDLDGFKAVNDTLGHSAGDATLRIAAQRLQGCVRTTDTVARIGGDEFIVVMPAGKDAGERTAQAIRAALANPIDCGDGMARIGASIGIAQFPEDGDVPEVLIRVADQSMYGAKRREGNAR